MAEPGLGRALAGRRRCRLVVNGEDFGTLVSWRRALSDEAAEIWNSIVRLSRWSAAAIAIAAVLLMSMHDRPIF